MSNPFQLLANDSSDNYELGDDLKNDNLPPSSAEQAQEDDIPISAKSSIQPQNQEEQVIQEIDQKNNDEQKRNEEEESLDPDHPTPEQIKNCPTVFQALGMKENRNVLLTFAGISLSLIIVGFGSFYLGKKYIPFFFPSIDPFDAPIYSCGLAVLLTQAIIFGFYFWAWGHDVAEEKREKELEEQQRRERLQRKIKKD